MINKIQVIERLKYNAALWLQQLDESDRKSKEKLRKQEELKKIKLQAEKDKKQAEITGTTNQPEAPQSEEQSSSGQPLNISHYAKKAIERQQRSGNPQQINAANVAKELQQGDSSNTSHNHKLKGGSNKSRSIHIGTTKGKITIQTDETPKETTITSVSPHENTKNNKRTRHGLAGQNAATSGGTGFKANNTPKNESFYYYSPAAARWLNEFRNYELQSRRQFLLEELYIRR